MEFLLEPLQFEFFRNALYASLMVGALCGLMGVFIVLQGMSYIGHGLSHAAFGGAVAGYLLNVNFYAAAAVAAVMAALLIQRINDGKRVRADAAIGTVTTAFFAIGVALLSSKGTFEKNFEAALFGNILGITELDLIIVGVVTVLCFLAVLANYRGLFFMSFDLEAASVFGVKVGRLQFLVMILLALCIIVSMNMVGATMIAAALVVPAASARMLTNSYNRLVVISPLIGVTMGFVGLFSSYYLDAASGATIVLTGAIIFVLAWTYRLYKDRYISHAHIHLHDGIEHAHPHSHEGDHAHQHQEGNQPLVHSHDGITHAHPDEHKHT